MEKITLEELFEIKQKFLRVIPHPTLIAKQLKKLGQPIELLKIQEFNLKELKLTLDSYTTDLLNLRLAIANAQNSDFLVQELIKVYYLHWELLFTLAHYCPEDGSINSVDVKLSDAFDTYDLSKFIVTQGIQETEIKEYLCKDLMINAPFNCSPLLLAVLRAKKIVNNG